MKVNAASAVGLVLAVWLLYLAVKVAEHVSAWPF
jgi:hypothetical protein